MSIVLELVILGLHLSGCLSEPLATQEILTTILAPSMYIIYSYIQWMTPEAISLNAVVKLNSPQYCVDRVEPFFLIVAILCLGLGHLFSHLESYQFFEGIRIKLNKYLAGVRLLLRGQPNAVIKM